MPILSNATGLSHSKRNGQPITPIVKEDIDTNELNSITNLLDGVDEPATCTHLPAIAVGLTVRLVRAVGIEAGGQFPHYSDPRKVACDVLIAGLGVRGALGEVLVAQHPGRLLPRRNVQVLVIGGVRPLRDSGHLAPGADAIRPLHGCRGQARVSARRLLDATTIKFHETTPPPLKSSPPGLVPLYDVEFLMQEINLHSESDSF